jgi:integrase
VIINRLTALAVSRIAKAGYTGDGGGLYLQVTTPNSKSWIFRYSMHGRRREMGLGPYPAIGLAEARELAAKARALAKSGTDPITARSEAEAERRLSSSRAITFKTGMELFLKTNKAGWRNDKHKAQWSSSLERYAIPTIGKLSIATVGITEITRILEPIWADKVETASRLRGRLERILDWARVRGYRTGDNPARWRGNLDKILPARRKVSKVRHHAAVPIDELPAVYQRLECSRGVASLALRFIILTAARASEVTGARWDEIDIPGRVWTVPAHRIKSSRVHRVPLSKQAIVLVQQAEDAKCSPLVFPSPIPGKALSLTSLSKALAAAHGGNATTHGFRSTFRDWASERTNFPREVAEMALAHVIGDKVEAAYRRGDLFAKRSAMMERWAEFATSPIRTRNVVSLTTFPKRDLSKPANG